MHTDVSLQFVPGSTYASRYVDVLMVTLVSCVLIGRYCINRSSLVFLSLEDLLPRESRPIHRPSAVTLGELGSLGEALKCEICRSIYSTSGHPARYMSHGQHIYGRREEVKMSKGKKAAKAPK